MHQSLKLWLYITYRINAPYLGNLWWYKGSHMAHESLRQILWPYTMLFEPIQFLRPSEPSLVLKILKSLVYHTQNVWWHGDLGMHHEPQRILLCHEDFVWTWIMSTTSFSIAKHSLLKSHQMVSSDLT